MIEILYNSLMLASLFAVAVYSLQIRALHAKFSSERGLKRSIKRRFIRYLKFSKLMSKASTLLDKCDGFSTTSLDEFEAADSCSQSKSDTTAYASISDYVDSDSSSTEIPFIDTAYTDEECRWLSDFGWTTDEAFRIKPLSRDEIKPSKALLKFRKTRRTFDKAALMRQMTTALQTAQIVAYAK